MRYQEAGFQHMFDISNIIPCMVNLSRTHSVELSYDDIISCDEPLVKPAGDCFIKKYFTYPSAGTVNCKYMKDPSLSYSSHKMIRSGMTYFEFSIIIERVII